MNESLSSMVKGHSEKPIVFSEDVLDIPMKELQEESVTEAEQQEELELTENQIKISTLSDWFSRHFQTFSNIKKPTVSIQGVNPEEQLIITVLKPGETEARKLVVFDDANTIPVLDLPAIDMQIFGNGFRIIYDLGNGIFIKSYGVKTGLASVFCNDIDDKLIPYAFVKINRKIKLIEIIENDVDTVRQKLSQPLDFEALNLRYKQSSKCEGLTSNQEAIDWLLERIANITDINHHLQIDNIIIDMLR